MIQVSALRSDLAINIMKTVGGAFAIAAASQMSIPMKPVSITFQTMAIMIIGLTYSPRLAKSTLATYLAAGVVGMPVLSNFNAGFPYMMGSTGGYLIGFLVAATTMAYFRKAYGSSVVSTVCNCLLGSVIIYAFGIAWLSQFVGFEKAFYSGFVVFIPTGLAKIALLSGIMRYIKKA